MYIHIKEFFNFHNANTKSFKTANALSLTLYDLTFFKLASMSNSYRFLKELYFKIPPPIFHQVEKKNLFQNTKYTKNCSKIYFTKMSISEKNHVPFINPKMTIIL